MQFAFQTVSVLLQSDMEGFDPTYFYIGMAIGIVIAIAVGYWVYKDASKRENNELLWSIGVAGLFFLTFFLGIIALIAYFILRGDVVEEESTGTGVAGDSWDTDTTQTDADDTDW